MKNFDIGVKRIKRNKFFLYSGAIAIGTYALLKNPFKFINNNTSVEKSSIKITQNPNAVKRKSSGANNV